MLNLRLECLRPGHGWPGRPAMTGEKAVGSSCFCFDSCQPPILMGWRPILHVNLEAAR